MDAVELPLPQVDVAAAPKLMGSEGFARAGVQVKEEDPRQPRPCSSIIECCSSRLLETDVSSIKTNAEFPSLIKGEELTKNLPSGIGKNCTDDTSRLEGAPFQRKSAKATRSYGSCSKKPRISQPEDSICPNGIEESKYISDKLGSHNLNCTSPEKSPLPKQKSNASKRGDKRSFKVPSAKSKYDSSSVKMGASIFGSACGGNNFIGLYGLKHDFQDVTTLMDEPPLDDLLKGTFDRTISSKDKGKKVSNMNESFISSVRKALSVLQSPQLDQSQNMAQMDCSPNKKISNFPMGSACAVEGSVNWGNEQSCTTDMSLCQKDPCSGTETRASPLDFPLYQPKDVLERLALNPSRDLESLLLDVSKTAVTTKSSTSNDLRSGKQVLRRASLPVFPWSHAFGGHSRSNYDTVKLSSSRITCQGKWTRIGVIASSTDIDRSCFTNIDSFNYDHNLVPSTGSSDNKLFASLFSNLPACQLDSSTMSCSKDAQVNAESGGRVDTKPTEEHCPKVLAAARILYDMATHAPIHNPDGNLRWQRKTSQKALKTSNFGPNEKLERAPSASISMSGSDLVGRSVEQIIPSKKPRLTIFDSKNSGHPANVRKGTYVWPTSKSSRSLPGKPVRDTILENKHATTTSTLKQHCMMPPPPRDLNKAYGGQQQVGKLVLVDWKRGRDKSD